MPRLFGWAREQISDTAARRVWGETAFAFGLIFGFAVIAEWIVRSILSRLLSRLPVRDGDTRLIRALFALLVLDLLPILVFAGLCLCRAFDGARPVNPGPDHLVRTRQRND